MHRSELLPVLKQRAHLVGRTAKRRLGLQSGAGESAVDRFHRLYYEAEIFHGTWKDTRWMGVPVWKCPFDLWVFQEVVGELRPELIIETGTAWGGSALFYASLCDLMDRGSVLSIDLHPRDPRPSHPRVRYLEGSSTDPMIVEEVHKAAAGANGVLVTLDSDHRCAHVLDELRVYSSLVPLGGYVIVEDTNINGHPAMPEWGPGPMEAVDLFLAEQDGFVVDDGREKFQLTQNPRGFLRRVH